MLVAVAACRQIAGLDDRPTLQDAGVDAGGPADAGATTTTFCASADASFCDDFEGADTGWTSDLTTDAGAFGEIVVGEDGRDSEHALRAVTVDNPLGSFRNTRLSRFVETTAQVFELSYAIYVPVPSFPEGVGPYQLSLASVPGTIFYPILDGDRLVYTWTTANGEYVVQPSEVSFLYARWHTFVLTIDLGAHTLLATIDGVKSVSGTYEPSGNAGAYTIALGLRTQGKTAPLSVRYDDVTVRFR